MLSLNILVPKRMQDQQLDSKIRVNLIFDVKHDGCHEYRFVPVPVESVHSGVRSLRGLILIADLNGLVTQATDFGSAYLEAKTQEQIYITADPEFGDIRVIEFL